MQSIIEKAKEIGFEEVGELNVAGLTTCDWVRSECEANKCKAYNNNWTCPPTCGTLEECGERMHGYSHGIIMQTVGHLESTFDAEGYMETEKNHRARIIEFNEYLHSVYPDALCLGAGGCRICAKCNFPEPCRFPGKAVSSMEGYGLFVTQVCRDNNLKYYYGENTITYTACALF